MRSSWILTLVITVFAAWPDAARACSCVVQEPRVARDAAVVVFEGVLLRHEDAEGGGVATFRVERVWKGDVPDTYAVASVGSLSMCPPHFEVGQRYIVYVDSSANGPHVRQCARYAFGPHLRRERAALGRPIRTRRR